LRIEEITHEWRCCYHVLEVVQDEQQLLGVEIGF
jgi:hypothetical protein